MRLKPEQVEQHLKRELAPVYLISGDEPLQLGEVADAVRAAAKKAGFEAREIFSEDTGIDWNLLKVSAGTLSIFSDKKMIDLRLPSAAPGIDGSKALVSYCERPPEDTLLLVSTGKLAPEALKSRWFQALEKTGIVIQVWPLEGQALSRWLQQRMQRRGLQADPDGVKELASRVEGNLLAAVQEIEKLFVLYGAGRISTQQIMDVVADSSRYDVYKLVDSVLAADISRLFKILHLLQAEGISASIVLWAITREVRLLIKMKHAISLGQSRETVFGSYRIREIRQQLVGSALSRLSQNDLNSLLVISAKADRQIKGQEQGDPWDTLLKICMAFSQASVLKDAI